MNLINLFGMPGGPELIVLFLIFILPAVIVLWALIDVIKSDFKDSTNKIIWLLLIIFLPLLGAILYFLIGRSQKLGRS
jgi:chromate transport protein ChrA